MNDQEDQEAADDARSYLLRLLRTQDVDLKSASRAVGMNDAYIQQYIRRGKPNWLPEEIRAVLVREYGADPERLKPLALRAPQVLAGGQEQGGEVQPPDQHQLADDSRLVELVSIWVRLTDERQKLALVILKNLVGN